MSERLREWPPRSILFVPGNRPELAAKAAAGAADAVCIDLEDGVAPPARPDARRDLPHTTAVVREAGKPVLVRINAGAADYAEDIDALPSGVDSLVLAKASGVEHIDWVGRLLDRRGYHAVTLLPMVEDIRGIDAFTAMGVDDARRLAGITIGAEDLAAELQCGADSRAMEHAFYRLLECARRLDAPLFGYPGSIAEFADLDRYRALVMSGVDMGAVGAFCIHPRQADVLNTTFSPGDDELAWAREVVTALDRAAGEGRGAVAVRGRMVDRPVALRARFIIARAASFNA